MKLVIDIPESDYKEISYAFNNYDGDRISNIMLDAFQNGVVLHKGHGRLGDLDALETEMINGICAGNYEEGYETFAHINDMDDCVECVRYADTIIEADKEGEQNADSD